MEHKLLSSWAMGSFSDDTHALTRNNSTSFNQPEQDMSQNLVIPHSPYNLRFYFETLLPVEEKITTEDTDESVRKISRKRPHGNRESV
ncbi:hypothetical protein MKX01_042425, partial [Papaver californicum]